MLRNGEQCVFVIVVWFLLTFVFVREQTFTRGMGTEVHNWGEHTAVYNAELVSHKTLPSN